MAEFDGPLALLLSLIEARQLDVLTVPLGGARRRVPRRTGRPRGGPAGQRQLVRGDRQPADPDQEPGDAPATPRSDRPHWPSPTKAPIPRPSFGPACSSTAPTAMPALRLADEAVAPDRPVPARAGRRPRRRPGRRPARPTRRRSIPRASSAPSTGWPRSRRRPSRPPEVVARTITHHRARRDHPRRPARRADVVLQDLLAGVRDRVVIAITFLAMLELMKRREIVVEQAEPWGPIVARATTAEERAAAGVDARLRRRAARRDPGVVRMTEDARARPTRSDATTRRAPRTRGRAVPGCRAAAPIELTEAALEALLFVAERPLVAPRDRDPRRHGPGDRRRPARRPRGVAPRRGASAC